LAKRRKQNLGECTTAARKDTGSGREAVELANTPPDSQVPLANILESGFDLVHE